MWRQAPAYVDKFLRGREASRLARGATDEIRAVINLKTAKALGLESPADVLARADEVIE